MLRGELEHHVYKNRTMRALREATDGLATGIGVHFVRTGSEFPGFAITWAESRCVCRHVDRDTADMIISGVAHELNSVVLPGCARRSSVSITVAKENGRSRSGLDLGVLNTESDLCRMELVTLD
jgi:hypothetical protein